MTLITTEERRRDYVECPRLTDTVRRLRVRSVATNVIDYVLTPYSIYRNLVDDRKYIPEQVPTEERRRNLFSFFGRG